MSVRYSIWKDEATQTFEVVMWDGKHPTIVKSGIKSAVRAHAVAARFRQKEANTRTDEVLA